MATTWRQAWVGLRFLLVMTVVLGVAYPATLLLVGRLVPGQADGSFVTTADGTVVGSALIGQAFEGDEWFHPRPSAAGSGYDALASSGSNLGPNNPDLVAAIEDRFDAVAATNGVPRDEVPPDAVTASASGLDPHISPAYAAIQVARVASARGLDPDRVRSLVTEHTEGPLLGFLGDPGVNVVTLNLALSELP